MQKYVLLIEDDVDISHAISDILESEGYSVKRAMDGTEGWTYIERDFASIGLVMLDFRMPGIDGTEILARLVAHSNPGVRSLPVLITSATASAIDAAKTSSHPYMRKPFEIEDLLNRVSDLVTEDEDSPISKADEESHLP